MNSPFGTMGVFVEKIADSKDAAKNHLTKIPVSFKSSHLTFLSLIYALYDLNVLAVNFIYLYHRYNCRFIEWKILVCSLSF